MELDKRTFIFMNMCDNIVEYALEKLNQRINENYNQVCYVVNQTQQLGDLEPLVYEWKIFTSSKKKVIGLYDKILTHVAAEKTFSSEDVERLIGVIGLVPNEGCGIDFVPKSDMFAKTFKDGFKVEDI